MKAVGNKNKYVFRKFVQDKGISAIGNFTKILGKAEFTKTSSFL